MILVGSDMEVPTFQRSVWSNVKRLPCCGESILRMRRLVGRDGFVKLFLADIAPGANCVADYFNVKVGHPACERPEVELIRMF